MSTPKNTTGHDWQRYSYPSANDQVLLPAKIDRRTTWLCERCGAVRSCKKKPPIDLRVNLPGIQLPNGRQEVSCDEAVVHKIMTV